jgi:ribonucleoside-diphosphate reductase alpha chain
MMKDAGFPWEPCVNKPDTTVVFSFPMESPKSSVKVSDQTAMEQLRVWKVYQDFWCEHKPSVTVYYTDKEFLEVGQWLYNNFDEVSGISFLPFSEHSYQQAPYQEISKEMYENALQEMPKDVNWSLLGNYEEDDNTTSSQTLACSGGVCDLVDLT